MADDRIPMTREGYEKLKAELSHLNDVKMIEVTKRVAAARDLGDLSENAEYHAAREDQGLLQAQIDLLRTAVTHEAGAQRMQAIFATQVGPMVARLSGETGAAAARRAGLIATQVLGVALCRYVLKLPPVVNLKRAELVRRVGATVQGYLYDA